MTDDLDQLRRQQTSDAEQTRVYRRRREFVAAKRLQRSSRETRSQRHQRLYGRDPYELSAELIEMLLSVWGDVPEDYRGYLHTYFEQREETRLFIEYESRPTLAERDEVEVQRYGERARRLRDLDEYLRVRLLRGQPNPIALIRYVTRKLVDIRKVRGADRVPGARAKRWAEARLERVRRHLQLHPHDSDRAVARSLRMRRDEVRKARATLRREAQEKTSDIE